MVKDRHDIDIVDLRDGGQKPADEEIAYGRRVVLPSGWSCTSEQGQHAICSSKHAGYVIGGTLHAVTADGTEAHFGPGEAYEISGPHILRVFGDESVVVVELGDRTVELDQAPHTIDLSDVH